MLCNASRERPKKAKKQKTKGEKKNAPINKQLYPLAPRPPLLPLLFSRVVQAEQVVGDDEGPGHGGQVEDLGEFEGVGLALGLWVRGRRKKMRGQVDGWGKKKSISLLFLSLSVLSLSSPPHHLTSSWPVTKTMMPPATEGWASMEETWCLQD